MFFLAHIPISVQTFKTAGPQLVGRLSVHPSEFNPRPLHFPTPPPHPSSQFHQRTVQLSWRKRGKIGLSDRASCYANMPSSLPSWGEHTHTHRNASKAQAPADNGTDTKSLCISVVGKTSAFKWNTRTLIRWVIVFFPSLKAQIWEVVSSLRDLVLKAVAAYKRNFPYRNPIHWKQSFYQETDHWQQIT